MYILSIDEVKDMIKFCSSNKVKNLKIGEVTIELSDYAFLEQFETQSIPLKEEKQSGKLMVDAMTPEEVASEKAEDEELMFWSSNS